VIKDRLIQALQILARFKTKIVQQHPSRLAVDIERIGLPPAAIQSEHQLPQQPLAVRVAADEYLQFADHVAAVTEQQVGLDPVLHRGKARFLQARDLALSKRLVGQVGERLAPPQAQRALEPLAGVRQVTADELVARVGDHRLEASGVDLIGRDRQQITAAARQQQLGTQRLA
jgi:hypothetical protein